MTCRVCRKAGNLELLTEKKVIRIFFIPVKTVLEKYDVCLACHARLPIKLSDDLLDAQA